MYEHYKPRDKPISFGIIVSNNEMFHKKRTHQIDGIRYVHIIVIKVLTIQ